MSALRGIRIRQSLNSLFRILLQIFHLDDLILYSENIDNSIPNSRWQHNHVGDIPTVPYRCCITVNLPCLVLLLIVTGFVRWLASAALAWTDSHILLPVITGKHDWPFLKVLAAHCIGFAVLAAFCASIVLFVLVTVLAVVGLVGFSKKFLRFYRPRRYVPRRGDRIQDRGIIDREQCLRYLRGGCLIIGVAPYPDLFDLELLWLSRVLNRVCLGCRRHARRAVISFLITVLLHARWIEYRSLVGGPGFPRNGPISLQEMFSAEDDPCQVSTLLIASCNDSHI
ncbi:hypothetical protein F5Y03DRAFT_96279 [Xylaria venustula]|nr:hypothetical protein F5Y03DRAFT_96279 [Xylaria venustula]